MSRLIDKYDFIDWLDVGHLRHPSELCYSELDVVNMIEHFPTVDAVPVVHGKWMLLDDCSNAGVYCSVCHKKVWKEDYAWCNRKNRLRSNYCPNCGADMREEQEDGE